MAGMCKSNHSSIRSQRLLKSLRLPFPCATWPMATEVFLVYLIFVLFSLAALPFSLTAIIIEFDG